MSVLGLDIGGANLKAAHSSGVCRVVPFLLWREPHALMARLRETLASFPPFERCAVTMTGELCDCFASQAEGVHTILTSVRDVAGTTGVLVWSLDGVFLSFEEAWRRTGDVAAANWLAQATLAGRLAPEGAALLIDIGSTTTDIVPLLNSTPVPTGRTDPERMAAAELLYTGAVRTPVCAVLGPEVAAEFFATMADVYHVLGDRTPAAGQPTADGKPATLENAHARLARMRCADPATYPTKETLKLALRARERQEAMLINAIDVVRAHLPQPPRSILVSGSGAFVLERLRPRLRPHAWLSLAQAWGEPQSACACAWAVARLAAE